jgi:hypothetical protein
MMDSRDRRHTNTEVPAMRIPRVRFTIRSIMIVVVLIAIVLGFVTFARRLYREQNDDEYINDPIHPRWRRLSPPAPKRMPRGRGTRPPILLARVTERPWGQETKRGPDHPERFQEAVS